MERYGFIVEGIHDEDRILELLPTAEFVVTGGTKFNNKISDAILQLVCDCKKTYILTDPDYSGDILANMILEEFPNLRRIKLAKSMCRSIRRRKLNIGVEHASLDYLEQVLSNYVPSELFVRKENNPWRNNDDI